MKKKNAENLLILKGNKALADRYVQNFTEHKSHAEEYQGKWSCYFFIDIVRSHIYYLKKI